MVFFIRADRGAVLRGSLGRRSSRLRVISALVSGSLPLNVPFESPHLSSLCSRERR